MIPSHPLAIITLVIPFSRFLAVTGMTTEANFLSAEEVDGFLHAVSRQPNNASLGPRLTSMLSISDDLHLRIRSKLSSERDHEEEVSPFLGPADVALTTITRTTSPHKDHYRASTENDRGRLVEAKTGLVFLETNQNVHLIHGLEHVKAEAGKLVVFEGSVEHYTHIPAGHRTKVLGPFALLGRGLSLVGDHPDPACMMVTTDTVLTGDYSCDCTGLEGAIKVQGPATLDLNGYQVSCTAGSPSEAVVRLSGSGATLLNGSVSGLGATFNDCVDMADRHQTVSGVTVKYCTGECISVENGADYAVITDNWIKECGEDGINVELADNVHISSNRIEECNEDGIHLDRPDSQRATISDNYIAAIEDDCIEIDGSYNTVAGNEMTGCGLNGIHVSNHGNGGNEISENVISAIGVEGIRVVNDHNLVSGNKISMVQENGIALKLRADYNTVTENDIRAVGPGGAGDSNGIQIQEGSNSNVVSFNKVSMTSDDGIDVKGDSNEIFNNGVDKTGDDLIDVEGQYNVIRGNTLTNTFGDNANGIELQGDHNIVRSNFVSGVTDDCLDIQADNTTVIGNHMKYCGDDGIEISEGTYSKGNNNVVKRNTAEACDIALDDDTGDEDCGSNLWKNNKGNTFMPDCAGNRGSSL